MAASAENEMIIETADKQIHRLSELQHHIAMWLFRLRNSKNQNLVYFSPLEQSAKRLVEDLKDLVYAVEYMKEDWKTVIVTYPPTPPIALPHADSPDRIAEITERNMNLLGDFMEYLKQNDVEVDESLLISYFEQ